MFQRTGPEDTRRTPEGQLKAGVRCLALSRDSCDGSLFQTLMKYATGHCKRKRARKVIERRIRIYEKNIQRFRKEVNDV